MSAKPTEIPTWADGASADVVVPTTGKRSAGWRPSERPPAQFFNWLFRRLGEWAQYLSDGDLVGNHTITGTLGTSALITSSGGFLATVDKTAETSHLTVHRRVVLDGVISPASISASQNDWAPTDFDKCSVVRVTSSSGTRLLNGLAGGAAGRVVALTCVATGGAVVRLAHEDGGSTAANRFSLPGAASLDLGEGAACILYYDATSSRWRVLSRT